jgi:hypothetical protein
MTCASSSVTSSTRTVTLSQIGGGADLGPMVREYTGREAHPLTPGRRGGDAPKILRFSAFPPRKTGGSTGIRTLDLRVKRPRLKLAETKAMTGTSLAVRRGSETEGTTRNDGERHAGAHWGWQQIGNRICMSTYILSRMIGAPCDALVGMPGERLHGRRRRAAAEEPRHEEVPEVVEPEA